MKRALTGIAAAAVVLGAVSPMAFAATTTSGLTKAGTLPIVVNGKVLSNPYEMTGKDSGNTTAFFPVYYFNQALSSIGYSATWDGTTHTWAITAPGVDASTVAASIAGGVGTGNTTITVNGTVVKKINTQAAKDPAASKTAAATTYFPAYYIDEIFNGLGAQVSFSGQNGLSITSATNTSGASLSAITATGASSGTGSQSSPAVALNSASVTLSTTLTDANGNPIANTGVTFNVSDYGTYTSTLPTVTNASGSIIAGTAATNAQEYTVYTNASGVASATFAGPSGQTFAYEVTATAPYAGANGQSISSQPSYVEFVANNEAGISPYAGSYSAPFNATMGTAVPVTVALPPNASGDAQANALVTLTVQDVNSSTGDLGDSTTAYFTNAQGADLGTTIQVATNSSGLAQVYLNNANQEEVQVSASLPSSAGVSNPNPTYISFGQGGIASQIQNYSITSQNVQSGQNVTVSGTLVDASGNPIANAQVLVVGNDVNNSGDFGTVGSNGTVTDFPDVISVTGTSVSNAAATSNLATGTPANSSYGDVITSDANGNFSFTVTDTDDQQLGLFQIYSIADGEVSGTPLKSSAIQFTNGTSLSEIAVAGTESELGNNDKSITGLTAPNHGSTNFWVEPQNAAGDAITGQSFTYSANVSNGGDILQVQDQEGNTITINGTTGVGATTITDSWNGSEYVISVPGGSTTLDSASPDLNLVVGNTNTGATTVTVQSGSQSATASINFTGGAPSYAQNFTPANSTITPGQSETVQYQVQDANGNAVANALSTIGLGDSSDPLWITQVNGVALDQSENMGTSDSASYSTEATPVPLGSSNASLVGYSTVNLPGVVSWSKTAPGTVQVYSDANGNVSLTLQASGVSYYAGLTADGNTTGNVATANAASTGTENVWTYASKSVSGTYPWQLEISNGAPISSAQQLGSISYGGAAQSNTALSTVTASAFTEAENASNVYTYTGTVTLTNAAGNPVTDATAADFSAVSSDSDVAFSVASVTPVAATPGEYTVVFDGNNDTSVGASQTLTVTVSNLSSSPVSATAADITPAS